MAKATHQCPRTKIVFSADVETEYTGEYGQAPDCVINNMTIEAVEIFGIDLTPEEIEQLPQRLRDQMAWLGEYEVDYA